MTISVARAGFTLFELILAIALSVTLVALIGTAINLYLTRIDASRSQVEEAQLARSILAMIAEDIRGATIYQPQDTSALAAMAESEEFDVDSVDEERPGGGDDDDESSLGGLSGGGTFGTGSGTSSTGTSSAGGGGVVSDSTLPLGLNGSLRELYVDATRLPRREELFATVTGYTNAPTGAATGGMAASATTAAGARMSQPSDLKSVRYFIRQGDAVEPGSIAATSLAPELQIRAGGLVRQEIPYAARVWAEQSGNTALLDSGQSLIAPEVVHIEFRYFDGTQVSEIWEMGERNSLPLAVEIRLWIASAAAAEDAQTMGQYGLASVMNSAQEYRQTVYLPMSQVSSSGGAGGMSGASGSSSNMSSGSTSSQSGSGLGGP